MRFLELNKSTRFMGKAKSESKVGSRKIVID
jgi:hypothetical protein